ncbi:hypothetical protein NUW54_g6843 [Trametes sanguinea]|uniref:Uncharacterized protein n=1 Tax=Trametes sanguinea TaxID=158606 RepID=A0ACC1PR39_9APHY|nr:hypothetical protein NUW54_g6843 [Trametes sanguinea]
MPAILLQRRHYNTLASILKDGPNRRCKISLHDVESALVALGFSVVNAKGSRFTFDPPVSIGRVALRLHLHKHELAYYHQDALKRAMQEFYGWGPEHLNVLNGYTVHAVPRRTPPAYMWIPSAFWSVSWQYEH